MRRDMNSIAPPRSVSIELLALCPASLPPHGGVDKYEGVEPVRGQCSKIQYD